MPAAPCEREAGLPSPIKELAMTRTFAGAPDLRPLPRFTFAGRGSRDSRREPRRPRRAAPAPGNQ
jgi:hypothetical protein